MIDRTHPLEDVLKTAAENADGDKVTVGELLTYYGDRSFGPILTFLGLIVVVPPIGAIPGLPAVIGVVVLLFSLQMLFGRRHVWAPRLLKNRSISKDALIAAYQKSKGVLARIDRLITERLTWATSGAATIIVAALVSLMALIMIPLELVPFAVGVPGLAITVFGVALIARDGALMLAAFALSAAALTVLIVFSPIRSWLGF